MTIVISLCKQRCCLRDIASKSVTNKHCQVGFLSLHERMKSELELPRCRILCATSMQKGKYVNMWLQFKNYCHLPKRRLEDFFSENKHGKQHYNGAMYTKLLATIVVNARSAPVRETGRATRVLEPMLDRFQATVVDGHKTRHTVRVGFVLQHMAQNIEKPELSSFKGTAISCSDYCTYNIEIIKRERYGRWRGPRAGTS